MPHIASGEKNFSLAILPLQLGSDTSRSTANVASYSVGHPSSVYESNINITWRLKPRHMQRLLSQPAKWMRRRMNSIAQRCCLVFIASIGSYDHRGLDEPIGAERTP